MNFPYHIRLTVTFPFKRALLWYFRTRGFSLTSASILELAKQGLGTRTNSENSIKRKVVIIGLEDPI